jgi:hypothetical protein
LAAPLIIILIGRGICEWLNNRDSKRYDMAINELDFDELRAFLLRLITKDYAQFLSNHIGDATEIHFASDQVLVDSFKILTLFAKLCKKVPGTDEQICYNASHHLKGVCHLYFPIVTQKGCAFIKLTLVSGESTEDGKKLKLHKYRALITQVAQKPNLRTLSKIRALDKEEDNKNHLILNGDQLLDLFGSQTANASPQHLSLTCAILNRDLLIYESKEPPPGGFTKRDFRFLQYAKHSDPRIIE